jgi:alanyl aminopeptidase
MGRLPEGVKPVGYTLALAVNPAMDYVTGTVKIDVQLESSTTLIWLHGQDLQVGEGYAVADNGKRHRLVYSQATEDGVARLDVTPALPAGQAALNLRFVAPYSTGLAGLYRVKANAVPYVFSQFEPLFARRAFPCFDEPRFKVPFQISLSIPDGLTAVTNTQPVGERSTGNGYTTLIFAATNPLPTYLLAVAVGPFDLVAAEVPRNSLRTHPLPLRGVAVAGRGPQMHYAVGHTAVLLDALERYFLSPYPFDKLDVLAVPDFAASAMENAGAITFRDWLLLMAPQQASVAQKHAFQSVMAHELSHQWFGNWVTMAWWDDLWLNESFATWMGQRTAQSVDPNGHYDLELLRGMHDVMSQDVLASARRVRQPCPRANDVHSAFDGITYSKGGALLNMFEHFMSKERFMVGIRRYLQSHANGTATADDFLADLSWAAGEPRLGEDFRTFLDQTGVPEVRFEVIGGPEHYALRLSQRPYMPLGRETLPKALWHIPVCWRAQSDGIVREACTVLRTAEAEVPLVGGEPTWLMPNAGGVGYYQWDLEPARLAKLTAAPLTAGESLAVARNLRRAYDAGTLAPETVLEAVASFVDGPGHDVALVPLALWADAYDMLSTPKARQQAAAYMAAKISPRFFALLKGAKGASPDDDAWGRDLGRFL